MPLTRVKRTNLVKPKAAFDIIIQVVYDTGTGNHNLFEDLIEEDGGTFINDIVEPEKQIVSNDIIQKRGKMFDSIQGHLDIEDDKTKLIKIYNLIYKAMHEDDKDKFLMDLKNLYSSPHKFKKVFHEMYASMNESIKAEFNKKIRSLTNHGLNLAGTGDDAAGNPAGGRGRAGSGRGRGRAGSGRGRGRDQAGRGGGGSPPPETSLVVKTGLAPQNGRGGSATSLPRQTEGDGKDGGGRGAGSLRPGVKTYYEKALAFFLSKENQTNHLSKEERAARAARLTPDGQKPRSKSEGAMLQRKDSPGSPLGTPPPPPPQRAGAAAEQTERENSRQQGEIARLKAAKAQLENELAALQAQRQVPSRDEEQTDIESAKHEIIKQIRNSLQDKEVNRRVLEDNLQILLSYIENAQESARDDKTSNLKALLEVDKPPKYNKYGYGVFQEGKHFILDRIATVTQLQQEGDGEGAHLTPSVKIKIRDSKTHAVLQAFLNVCFKERQVNLTDFKSELESIKTEWNKKYSNPTGVVGFCQRNCRPFYAFYENFLQDKLLELTEPKSSVSLYGAAEK